MIVYSDMDGVAAHLPYAISQVTNRTIAQVAHAWTVRKEVMWANNLDLTEEEFEKVVSTYHNPKFWAELPLVEDYDYFYRELHKLDVEVIFLSAANRATHIAGKNIWLDKYFPKNQRIFYERKWEKATPDTILIDDSHNQIDPFREAGGHGILVPQEWNGGVFEGRKTWDSILEQVKEIVHV